MRGAEQGLGGAGIEAKRTCVCLGLALQLSETGAEADAGQGEGLNGDERRRLPVLQLTRVPTPAHAQLRAHRVAAAEAPLSGCVALRGPQDKTQPGCDILALAATAGPNVGAGLGLDRVDGTGTGTARGGRDSNAGSGRCALDLQIDCVLPAVDCKRRTGRR